MVELDARYQDGVRGGRLLQRTVDLAERLDRLGAAEAAGAHLLAGRLSLDRGDPATADLHLLAAGALPAQRATARPGRGLAGPGAALRGQRRSPRDASGPRSWPDALDEHRLTMGATELRARATTHGLELAVLASAMRCVAMIPSACWPGASVAGHGTRRPTGTAAGERTGDR